jgi:tRNA/tmRNA/rRNA uracil-C5-methylase (TrmA/RlmC/RlmD family)
MNLAEQFNPTPKPGKSVRIKPTQRMMGDISAKVRKEVRMRSQGSCEVKERCTGDRAVQMAHITSRKQLTHKTTAADILDSCISCHKWLDEDPDGIKYKRKLAQGLS